MENSRKKFAIIQGILITSFSFLISFQVVQSLNIPLVIIILTAPVFVAIIYSIRKVRCLFLLSLVQIFTSRGRNTFIAYIFYRTTQGPGKNLSKNLRIVSRSIGCFRKCATDLISEFANYAHQSIVDIKQLIDKLVPELRKIYDEIIESIGLIDSLSNDVAETVTKASEWLEDITNLCDENQTPFARCMKMFEAKQADCLEAESDNKQLECDVFSFKPICAFMKIFEVACDDIKEFLTDPVIESKF